MNYFGFLATKRLQLSKKKTMHSAVYAMIYHSLFERLEKIFKLL